MESSFITRQLNVEGMSCSGCEGKIEKKLKALNGVQQVTASYNTGKVDISYDDKKVNLKQIKKTITELDYNIVSDHSQLNKDKTNLNFHQIAFAAIILLGGYVIINRFGVFDIFNNFPQATANTSYIMLFVIGLLTSVHCIAMCGGISLSQCVGTKTTHTESKWSTLRPSLLYNLGRVASYTIVGGIVGGLGAVVSFSGRAKGLVAVFAGVFMIIMGLNMLNIFPWLRRFNIRMPKFLTRGINDQKKSNSPLYVGLLNGLMPCGPLQAMQLYALSTGDPIKGALSMFLFSLGTAPLMFGFGTISTLLSRKFTANLLSISAVLVIIMGIFMFNNGLSLSGVILTPNHSAASVQNNDTVEIIDGVQVVTIDVSPRSYAPITVKKDIPVKWVVKAEAQNINGCNNEIIVPAYDISKKLVAGDNIIEFTPTETGTIPYSCWMGMIRSKITVID